MPLSIELVANREHGGRMANGKGVGENKGEVTRPRSLTDTVEFLRNRTLSMGPSRME